MLSNTRIAVDIGLLESLFKKNTREREEGLMLAVLEDAVYNFQKYVHAEDKRGKRIFLEAEEWILERNSDWFFSIDNVCEVLGLDPNRIRRGLLRWKAAKRKARLKAEIHSLAANKKIKKSASIDARSRFMASA